MAVLDTGICGRCGASGAIWIKDYDGYRCDRAGGNGAACDKGAVARARARQFLARRVLPGEYIVHRGGKDVGQIQANRLFGKGKGYRIYLTDRYGMRVNLPQTHATIKRALEWLDYNEYGLKNNYEYQLDW